MAMKADFDEAGGAAVELDAQELVAFANCLNETLEAVEEWEFSTRVGVERSVVEAMLGSLSRAPM